MRTSLKSFYLAPLVWLTPCPSLGPLQANIRTHVKNLDVVFDSELKFDKQINSVVSASFFQLRGLRKLKSLLSFGDLESYSCLHFYKALLS